MKKFLQIQNGMVFICGPTSAGKTTLARRILAEAPYPDKALVSHDEMLEVYLKAHDYPLEVAVTTGLEGEDDEEFKATVFRAVRDALNQRKFVIFEGVYEDAARLSTLLDLLPAWGLKRPLTLIKLWPSLPQQTEFIMRRYRDIAVNLDAIIAQRENFKEIMQPNAFSKNREWIKEYTIIDPRSIVLEFRRSGELSNELLAAYECYETFRERHPDLVLAGQNF